MSEGLSVSRANFIRFADPRRVSCVSLFTNLNIFLRTAPVHFFNLEIELGLDLASAVGSISRSILQPVDVPDFGPGFTIAFCRELLTLCKSTSSRK